MTTRERLARIICCGTSECRADASNRKNIEKEHVMDVPCSAPLYGDEVDAVLDELMEPGKSALEAGITADHERTGGCHVEHVFRTILTHIKNGKS